MKRTSTHSIGVCTFLSNRKYGKRCSTILIILLSCIFLQSSTYGVSTVVASVDGEPIYLEAVDNRVKASSLSQSMFSSQASGEISEKMRLAALEDIILEEVILSKMDELGVALNDEDLLNADLQVEKLVSQVEEYINAHSPGASQNERDQLANTLMDAAGLSEESIRTAFYRSTLIRKVREAIMTQSRTASKVEVLAEYDNLYAYQSERYKDDPAAMEADMLANEIIVHRPYESKVVLKAEILIDPLVMQIIRNLRAVGDDKTINEIMDDQDAILRDEVQLIYGELLNGRLDFLDFLESKKPGSSVQYNYLTPNSPRLDEVYLLHARELEYVGDISAPFKIDNGFAILYLVDELPVADYVPVTAVQEDIGLKLSDAIRERHVEDVIDDWVEAASIIYHLELLK